MELSKQLEANFAMLQEGWPECKMDSICGTDLYYTDGLAEEAVFKIEFKQKSLYVTNQLSFAVVSQTISSLIYFEKYTFNGNSFLSIILDAP